MLLGRGEKMRCGVILLRNEVCETRCMYKWFSCRCRVGLNYSFTQSNKWDSLTKLLLFYFQDFYYTRAKVPNSFSKRMKLLWTHSLSMILTSFSTVSILNLFNISMLLNKCIIWWFWFDATTKDQMWEKIINIIFLTLL